MSVDFIVAELRGAKPENLEAMYARRQDLASLPRGTWRGHHLQWIDNPGSRRLFARSAQRLMFEWTPWGIDFDRRLWFFWTTRAAAGRFELRAQRSRWRDTDTFGLHYGVSRLPAPIRRLLYDEVKPLSPAWMIGIGGVDAERGLGDHFFFVLEKVEPS
jgi:hypothetical protein